MPDVEMKSADDKSKKDDKKESDKKGEKPKPVPPTPNAEIKTNIALIERAVSTIEPRFTHRVLRTLNGLRKKVDEKVLREAIDGAYPKDSPVKQKLSSWLPPAPAPTSEAPMEVDSIAKPPTAPPPEPVPEVDIYLRLLVIFHFLTSPTTYAKAKDLVHETIEKMQALNRRSMDPIAAKVWYAVERCYELGGALTDARPLFLAAQRSASLRHDSETLATLINCLLRSYIVSSLYSQADALISKVTFPATASNPQFARYHYYLGRIKTVQLNYTAAHTNLQQAIRRAPQAKTAPGFYQAVHKLFVVIELLMGDIPERSLFRHPVLEKALSAYFEIVKAVRTGSLSQFATTLSAHAATFSADNTYTLILRLRQNVIKTGIRRLSLSYSLISLKDICLKLHLDSEEDAEYIVGKAIRDGVIEAKINHKEGWMECAPGSGKGYGSEVSEVFARRIGFCLELHNESVKAMRYPLNAHRKELDDNARERERDIIIYAHGDMDEQPRMGEGF